MEEKIVKGFDLEGGIGKYDYESLANLPDLSSYAKQEKIQEIENKLQSKADVLEVNNQFQELEEQIDQLSDYVTGIDDKFLKSQQKVTEISELSTDNQIPTAKSIYDFIQEQLVNQEF